MSKKIIISGGSGFLGRNISTHLKRNNGYKISVLTRGIVEKKPPELNADEFIEWPDKLTDDFIEQVSNADYILNLAGASIAGKRWTEDYKQKIIDSRIDTASTLVQAIEKSPKKPSAFISASAVGFYGDRQNEELTEKSSQGSGFLSEVSKKWENEAQKANRFTRVVTPRIGVVLDNEEGALAKMKIPFKLYIGGPLGSGKQWVPWIHIDDITALFEHIIENDNISGAVNFTSPEPVNMADFAKSLGKALHRPAFFKVPEFLLKTVLGESSEMILNSQRVIPKKALESGYKFKYTNIKDALNDIF